MLQKHLTDSINHALSSMWEVLSCSPDTTVGWYDNQLMLLNVQEKTIWTSYPADPGGVVVPVTLAPDCTVCPPLRPS
jgi:hypothetical protein